MDTIYRLLKVHNWIFLILCFQDFEIDNTIVWEIFSHSFFLLLSRIQDVGPIISGKYYPHSTMI